MTRRILPLCIFLFISFFATAQNNEYYFRFLEKNKDKISTSITRIISIDNVVGDTVYAYANDKELAKFKKLGYNIEFLPAPSALNSKAITMATTVAEMANWDKYPTYEVYRAMMKGYAQDYPSLCTLDSVGTSVNGRKIYMIKISDNAATHEAEPKFLYSSTMHGDETTGFIMLLQLIDYLLSQYATNTDIQDLVNSTQIYILPNTNPDGTYYGGNTTVASSRRYNANGVDLNRNFPCPNTAYGTHPDDEQWQVETVAMMDFGTRHNFVMGANLHGGTELLNYPWDCWYSSENMHADNDWFKQTCREYADSVHLISSSYLTAQNNGITHGADWYKAPGSRQDYMNYVNHCREITIEVSTTKCPSSSSLPTYWNYNRKAMIKYIKLVHTGFNGTVKNQNGDALNATITVLNHDKDGSTVVTDTVYGNYYRPIAPGTYNVQYTANGYYPETDTITVADYTTGIVNNVVLVKKQAASLSGTITDSETGSPIYNAAVSVGNMGSTTTSSNGIYTLNSIYEGDYSITIGCTSYTTRTLPITLTAGENTQNYTLTQSQAENFEGSIPDGITFSGGNWTRSNTTAYNGDYCMQSAAIGNSTSTSMLLTLKFAEAGNFSFAKKVSSESSYDYLKFYIDDVLQDKWSGSVDWDADTFAVTSGTHTFKWAYVKDAAEYGGSDCAWVDFIETPVTRQDVIFTTTINGTPKQGLTVTFNDTGITTSSNGKATFSNVERGNNLPYTVKLADSVLATENLNVYWVDINKSIDILCYYTVNFAINDQNSNAVENARVQLNNTSLLTNASGAVTFTNVPYSNSLDYTISKDGFTTLNSTTAIHNDTTINLTISENTSCNVTFSITSNGNALSNATVSFNSTQQTTNSNGSTTFADVPLASTLSYTISKEGYADYSNSVYTNADTTISINLTYNNLPVNNFEQVSIWPSPFSTTLTIDLSSIAGQQVTATIYNLLGQTVEQLYNGTANGKIYWSPNSKVSKGIYLVVIKTDQNAATRKVVFR